MKKSPNKVSVVIPSFNREKFLPEAIQSVLDQNGSFNIEVIVVDDGSTDRTSEVIKKFGERVRYFKNEASGRPAVARNFGLKKATHEIVAFQDSDDLWGKNKLRQQLATFEDDRVALSYGNAQILGEGAASEVLSGKDSDGDLFQKLVNENFISTLTVMARKQTILELGGFNESWDLRGVEDYELWLRMSAKHQFKFINKTLAYYRQHDGNISSIPQLEAHKKLISVMNSLYTSDISTEQKIQVASRLSGLHQVVYDLGGGIVHLLQANYNRGRAFLIKKSLKEKA